MNENFSPSTSATLAGLTAEVISRRAYELWEQEGRPEGRDLHHWLRAEQELIGERSKSNPSAGTSAVRTPGIANTDTKPLQGTRAAAAASREAKPAAKRAAVTTGNGAGKTAAASVAPRAPARNGVKL